MSSWLRAAHVASVTLVLCSGAALSSAQEAPADPAPEEEAPPEETPPEEASPEEAEPPVAQDTAPAGLVEARAAIGEAQFTVALEALERALQEGSAQPEHLQEIYRLQGETLVAVGKAAEAKEAFKILLVLNADAALGEFASPKIVAVLEEARVELAGGALAGRHHFDLPSRRLEVSVDSDPLAMSSQVRLSYPRQDASPAVLSIPLEEGKAIFDVPAQASTGVHLALLDRQGNVILSWAVEALPVAAVEKKDPELVVVDTGPEPIWSKWWVYAGAGAAFATVGTVFGIASSSAQGDLDELLDNPAGHFFSDAKALEDKAQSRATLANVSFVMAGALGIASGVLYWRSTKQESPLQVVPAADGTGASLLMGGRF
jgi:hypothetical protein